MKLPDKWGQGALFSYSAVFGLCKSSESFSARLCADSLAFYFLTDNKFTMSLYSKDITDISFESVMTDFITASVRCGEDEHSLKIVFASADTVLIESGLPLDVRLWFDEEASLKRDKKCSVYTSGKQKISLAATEAQGIFRYVLSCKKTFDEPCEKFLSESAESIVSERIAFYEGLPRIKNTSERIEKLYYRCVSLLLACTYSADGIIKSDYITPAKGSMNSMYSFWSAISVLGMRHISPDLARDTLNSILASIAGDGMISARISPEEKSDDINPPVLAWCFWELYSTNGDKKMLSDAYASLKKYIHYLIETRDINKNHLPEWQIAESEDEFGKESIMDNSPRFDDGIILDSVDFSSWIANEAHYMKLIALEIQKHGEGLYWDVVFERTKTAINELLFDEDDKIYYDRAVVSGMLKKVKTSASFLPLFAGICDNRHAMALLKLLNSEEKFNLRYGIPSVSADSEEYGDNMWRGPVHILMNSLVAAGLDRYTMHDKANEIKAKTLDAVLREFENTGLIFEYYSPDGERGCSSLPKKSCSASSFMFADSSVNIRDFAPTAAMILDMLFLSKNKGKFC
ncbi:MAG: hypothetical protein J6B23_04785 [Clostridia bacterium]|nr:hypothetical protein [Clostridia bacterium]